MMDRSGQDSVASFVNNESSRSKSVQMVNRATSYHADRSVHSVAISAQTQRKSVGVSV